MYLVVFWKRGLYSILTYQSLMGKPIQLIWTDNAPQFTNSLSDDFLTAIDEVWESRPPYVFNGSIYIHQETHIYPDYVEMVGVFTEYKFYYTQKALGQYGVVPISVSGTIWCEDHLILAKRSQQVTNYQGFYELAPSGTIDKPMAGDDGMIDFRRKLREEFYEETTLSADVIQQITPFALVEDPSDPVIDVYCFLELETSKDALLEGIASTDEYDDPVAIPRHDVMQWFSDHQDRIIPPSRHVIEALFADDSI